MSIKVLHIGDVHFCDKFLDEVGRCMAHVIEIAKNEKPDLIVIPGDTFDHRLEQNSPALMDAIETVRALADVAPTVILQGTLSHDAPHAIDIFEHVESTHGIEVVSSISQLVINSYGDVCLCVEGKTVPGDRILISCLPSVNKGIIASQVGAEHAAEAAGEIVARLLKGWSTSHLAARAAGVPSIVISHGTVSGSRTEHGCPMAGLDLEFTTGSLFASEASAVMLNHIHAHQAWANYLGDTGHARCIAYAGSVGRLHFGEKDQKCVLVWDVAPEQSTFDVFPTPARELVEIEFTGTPDIDEIRRRAAGVPKGAQVRVRYAVDVEHRASVDEAEIARVFDGASVDLKVESRVLPIQRQRAAGITEAPSLHEKVQRWCELTGSPYEPLAERLTLLLAGTTDTTTEERDAA